MDNTPDRIKAAEKLMQALQAGINSAQEHGWISEEEAARLLLEAENVADLQIYEVAMQQHRMDPETYTLDEVLKILEKE